MLVSPYHILYKASKSVDGERELVLKHTDQQTKIVRWYRPQAITWFGPEAYVKIFS
jgi:hypothetical protein